MVMVNDKVCKVKVEFSPPLTRGWFDTRLLSFMELENCCMANVGQMLLIGMYNFQCQVAHFG